MADDNTSEADRVLRVLMRFGLDQQSAQEVTKAIEGQESSLADLQKQWDILRNQAGLSEKETVTAIQGSITGMKLQEDQILAIGKAYEDKQAAESAAAQQVQADLAAEADRLKQIEENTNLIAASFTNVMALGKAEVSFGRGLTSLGRLIGNDQIVQLGQATTAVGRFTSALGRLPQALKAVQGMGDVISKLAGGGSIAALLAAAGTVAAAAGAALAAAKLLDKYNRDTMIATGKTISQGLTLTAPTFKMADIAKQGLGFPDIGKALGLDSLGYEAKSTGDVVVDSAEKIKQWGEMVNQATGSIYDPAADAAGIAYDTAKKLREVGVSDFSTAGLENALDQNKKLLQLRLTEGDVVGSTAAQVSEAIRTIEAAQKELAAADPMTQGTPAFEEYQKSITQSEKEYGAQRERIVQSNLKQINDLTQSFDRANVSAWNSYLKAQQHADQNYADQRLKILNSGVDEAQRAEKSYYDQRSKAAEAYGIEVQRAEEAHQVEMRRMNEDHTKKLRKLADDRDALGIEDEMESYRTERGRAEEDYQRQAAQRNQDYARQIAEMENAFREQEQVRKDDRAKQLAELDRQKAEDDAQRKADYNAAAAERKKRHDEDLAAAQQEGQDKLDQAAQQHKDDLTQLSDAWDIRRRTLGIWLTGEQGQWDNYMAARQTDLQKWIDTHLSVGSITPAGEQKPDVITKGPGAGQQQTAQPQQPPANLVSGGVRPTLSPITALTVSQQEIDLIKKSGQSKLTTIEQQERAEQQKLKDAYNARQALAAAALQNEQAQLAVGYSERTKAELDQAQQAGKDKLDQNAQNTATELNQIDQSWYTRRHQLSLWLVNEQTQMDNYMKARQADLQTWVDTHLVLPATTGAQPTPQPPRPPTSGETEFQTGGYKQSTGPAYMHAGEFVTNPATTRALERMIGGQLTQQNLIEAMAGKGQSGPITISVNQSFSGQESNPAQYRAIVYQTLTEVIDKAMRQ